MLSTSSTIRPLYLLTSFSLFARNLRNCKYCTTQIINTSSFTPINNKKNANILNYKQTNDYEDLIKQDEQNKNRKKIGVVFTDAQLENEIKKL